MISQQVYRVLSGVSCSLGRNEVLQATEVSSLSGQPTVYIELSALF